MTPQKFETKCRSCDFILYYNFLNVLSQRIMCWIVTNIKKFISVKREEKNE